MTRPGPGASVDVVIAAVVLAGSLWLISHDTVPGSVAAADLDGRGMVLAVFASAPLVVGRLFPMGVFTVVTLASALLVGLGYPLGIPIGACVALYLVAAGRDASHAWTHTTTAPVVGLLGVYVAAAGVGDGSRPGSALLHGGLGFAVAWFAGERTRLRREQIAVLEERALRAERGAEHDRRLAVAEERVRIARDLHDAVGHAINLITVRAGAARLRQDPDRSRAALEVIEEIARQTAADIDGIVGTLRDPNSSNGASDTPLGLASLDTLTARHAAAGLDVRVARRGTPQQLASAVDQAAYRILQEALTNAARHGTGQVRVDLAFGRTALDLMISNPAPAEAGPDPHDGHGLVGMRERAALLGGSLTAERANGSFQVRAHLPYGGPDA